MPPEGADLSAEERAAWRAWLRDVGQLVRRMRELLDLSQDELGRLAHVSQGAISRFEKGVGLSTPWIIAVKIRVALAARIRQLDPSLLTPEARRFLAQTDLYGLPRNPAMPPAFDDVALLPVPELEAVLRTYSRLPRDARQTFARMVTAIGEALGEQNSVHPAKRQG